MMPQKYDFSSYTCQDFREKILEKGGGEKENRLLPGLEESRLFYECLTKSVKFDQLSTLNPLGSLTDFLNHSILESSSNCFYKCSQIIIHRHVCTALHPLETILFSEALLFRR